MKITTTKYCIRAYSEEKLEMTKIFTDYDEYKAEIAQYVDGITGRNYLETQRFVDAIKAIKYMANRNLFTAPFLFQDEDARHFNADIAKRCRELLDKCNTSC